MDVGVHQAEWSAGQRVPPHRGQRCGRDAQSADGLRAVRRRRAAAIDPLDIAEVAAAVLREPGHAGRAYELTGPEPISPRRQAEAIAALARTAGGQGGRMAAGRGTAAVAASGTWTDPDGVRALAGEVHAWLPGTNQTLCGLALSRTRLLRFPHVPWPDVLPESGGSADRVQRVCPRCAAAAGGRRDRRPWTRTSPRP